MRSTIPGAPRTLAFWRRKTTPAEDGEAIALLSLQPNNDSSPTEDGAVTVQEGDTINKSYTTESELRNYLNQYPEATNDKATRLFHYGPHCDVTLKLALCEKLPFLQFSTLPGGLGGPAVARGMKTATCGCERCIIGVQCNSRAVESEFSFWQFALTSNDDENRLEVTGNDQSFTIYAGGQ